MRRLLALALSAALGLSACTIGVRREAAPTPPTAPSTVAPASLPACSTTYAAPDPKRPVVRLAFEVSDDHRVVTGTERVTFTPDRPVSEVVFRLWPNGPGPARLGGRLEVTRASLPMRYESAGGGRGTPGTLLRLDLPAESPAGRAVTVDLAFTLTLPRADLDRWGHTSRTAWWASAHPMLAWVRGHGWHTADAVGLLGETQAAEVADHDVTVVAPPLDTVLGPALPSGDPVAVASGKRRWRFRNDRARDVAVSVGPFATRQVMAGSVPILVAVSEELAIGTAAESVFQPVVSLTVGSVSEFARRFGPYPFDSLTVVALRPIEDSGVEYPGLIYVGSDAYDFVVPHEVAHEWFYALVGNDQARDPWLDEAFATFGEVLFSDRAGAIAGAVAGEGAVGRPMSHWDEHRGSYGATVYRKGAAALFAGRSASGAAAFDLLLRCYVARMAYRVATPADVAEAFAPLPAVTDALREAGALP